ncbi:unnamed protein product [Amaranthus hypochondriacus]
MTTSSFKSTSRKPISSSSTPATNKQPRNQQNSTQQVPLRRSRSMSAYSRTHLDITTEFHNKIDNPLFWDDDSSHFEENNDGFVKLSEFEILKSGGSNNVKGFGDECRETRRGRSVSRNSNDNGGGRTDFGRSLSRVSTHRRRRSLSRGHYGNFESEKDRENDLLNYRSINNISSNTKQTLLERKSKPVRSASDLSEILKGSKTWSSQHPAFESSDISSIKLSSSPISHWDDGRSSSSISEAEERIIKPVLVEKIYPLKDTNGSTNGILESVRCEVRQAISDMQNDFKIARLRSGSDVTHGIIVSDFAPEPEDTNTVGLAKDIRDEFSRELEECEERTRKLRAELAVEEHREIELNKILNDIVPEPKTPHVEKPRAIRKASFERKKMSRRLEQEALAYFDECVSISTFEDSDFSSLEDLTSTNMASIDGLDVERPSSSFFGVPRRAGDSCFFDTQTDTVTRCKEGHTHNISANHSSYNNSSEIKGLGLKSSDGTSLKDDIRNYVKKFSLRERNDSGHRYARDYSSEVSSVEKLLVDRVTYRSRIESGSMLLCGGGSVCLSLPPFSSVFW